MGERWRRHVVPEEDGVPHEAMVLVRTYMYVEGNHVVHHRRCE